MTRFLPFRFVVEVFREFFKDGCDALAGSLAFFTLFSLPPLLALVIDVASLVADPDLVVNQLRTVVETFSGPSVAEQATAVAEAVRGARSDGPVARVVGLLLVLFTATIVVAQAQRALNIVWAVRPRRGLRGFLVKRSVSLALIMGFVAVLWVSIGSGAFLATLGSQLDLFLPRNLSSRALRVISDVISFWLLCGFTTALHRWLPEARVPFRDVLAGGMVTAFLLGAGQVVISWIISTGEMGSVYGAARSLALLLFWVFYASALFLWGAEFIKVLARYRGHEAEPVPGAERA